MLSGTKKKQTAHCRSDFNGVVQIARSKVHLFFEFFRYFVNQFPFLWIPRINTVREYRFGCVPRKSYAARKVHGEVRTRVRRSESVAEGWQPKTREEGLWGDEERQDATHIY